jgi:hypothetical protein
MKGKNNIKKLKISKVHAVYTSHRQVNKIKTKQNKTKQNKTKQNKTKTT